jgi:hypothetical protein
MIIDIAECKILGLEPTELFVISYLYEGKIARIYPVVPNPIPIFEQLADKGFLDWNSDENKVKLTDKTKVYFNKSEDYDSFIEQYRQLFKDTGKLGAMGDKKGCIKKMKKFMAENPEYSKVVIIQAAEAYIESVRDKTYLRQADYAIEKNGISTLGNFCEGVQSGDVASGSEDMFTIKV